MKKTLLKLLATIASIAAIVLLQEFIRDYFSIDRRIWFFVQYIGAIFLFGFFGVLLDKDIKMILCYFKNCKKHFYNLKQHSNICINKFIDTCKNNKILKQIYDILFNIIWIPSTAIMSFNIFYPDTYITYNWMKILSFILYFIFTLCLFVEYKNSRKKFDFLRFILWTICCIIVLIDLLISIV